MRNNDETGLPAAMPEAKDADEQQAIIDQAITEAGVATDVAPDVIPLPDPPKIIPAKQKWQVLKLYSPAGMVAYVFIEPGIYQPYEKSTTESKFNYDRAHDTNSPEFHIIRLNSLKLAPPIIEKITQVLSWTIYANESVSDYDVLQRVNQYITLHCLDALNNPLSAAIIASSLNVNHSYLPEVLFNTHRKNVDWLPENRVEVFKIIKLLIDRTLKKHFDNIEAMYTFMGINKHLDKIDDAKQKPWRPIVPNRIKHIASFLMGDNTQLANELSLLFLQVFTMSHGHAELTETCIFIEFAKLCFYKDPASPYDTKAVDYFVKILRVLPNKERIAWLGVEDKRSNIYRRGSSTSFSALYYIALGCSVADFKRVVNFNLTEQPHLLDDVLKAAVLINPRLLYHVINTLTPTQLQQAFSRCFNDKSNNPSKHLPALIHKHYRDQYNFYEDYESEYERRCYNSTVRCGIEPNNSAEETLFLVLNIPLERPLEANKYFYWHTLFKLCQSPNDSNPLSRIQLAISHHFNTESGSLNTVIHSFIDTALAPGSDLISLYPDACLALSLAIVQHGSKNQAGTIIAQFMYQAILHYETTETLDFSLVRQLLDHMDAKDLHQTDIHCAVGTADFYPLEARGLNIYFDLLVSIKNPAMRLTVAAKLWEVSHSESMTGSDITQLIDLLREDIAVVKCEDLHKDTINQLGKFFHPFDSELTEGETSGQRIARLITSADAGTVTVAGSTTDIEIDTAATTHSDFKQGYLITALSNFKRRSFGWNSFEKANATGAPSQQLPSTLFKLASSPGAGSGKSGDLTDEDHPALN
ncbi:MAG: hypothetical protein P1U40_09360 [Coxiellaceae bacterium]|nr:hypothetical protein [Coxiellaceae bacterium]